MTCAYNFSCYQENPSQKDTSKGALLVNNLDSSISNQELNRLVKSYGEVKEVGILGFSLYLSSEIDTYSVSVVCRFVGPCMITHRYT